MKREKTYFDNGNGPAGFSLLYPKGAGESSNQENLFLALEPAAAHDLRLDELISAFTPDRESRREIQSLFQRVPRDPDVISYRQAVLEDLLAHPALTERLTSLLPVVHSLFESAYRSKGEMSWLHEVVRRAEELQIIIDCFEGMGQILDEMGAGIHSEGLRNLQEEIGRARRDPVYQNLVRGHRR